ncbi:ribonuclease H family protein [Priestia megaterium]|uniref:ribonuclease H family protein n=1 Tax=Priestia megaterium TaxID=1404 RepID=UPI002E1F510D|nr:ribonuclease H family protein [Priestia megaterium]MED4287816.1 ribonuclease H family protein [Priestia megaterium]MED4296207.1 ribonuclease H family protein [Priestia megaterium]
MNFQIEWHYKSSKYKQLIFTSDFTDANEALMIVGDLEKTGRTKEIFLLDEQQQKWTVKEAKKLLQEVQTEPHDIVAYFDGGYEHDTLLAGLGVVIYFKQNNNTYRIRRNSRLQEIESNNEAEYAAFYYLIQELEELGVHHIPVTFRGDSQVVLNQLAGEWPCFEEEFNRYLDRIEDKMQELGIRPVYEPISRKENEEADQLATQALQGIPIASRKQV